MYTNEVIGTVARDPLTSTFQPFFSLPPSPQGLGYTRQLHFWSVNLYITRPQEKPTLAASTLARQHIITSPRVMFAVASCEGLASDQQNNVETILEQWQLVERVNILPAEELDTPAARTHNHTIVTHSTIATIHLYTYNYTTLSVYIGGISFLWQVHHFQFPVLILKFITHSSGCVKNSNSFVNSTMTTTVNHLLE